MEYHGNYVMYLRKSRADIESEQRGEEETLARHEKTLLDVAKRLHLNLVDIYREVVSGETIAARPVMQKLLYEVEQGVWNGVLVMEVERLARGDTIDQGIVAQSFKYSDTKIITPLKTYDPQNEYDEEYFEFGLFMSRREYKTINRRLQRGRIASIKDGKYVSSQPPYGYSKEKLEHDKGFKLVPCPDQAKIVQLIFDLYTSGELTKDNGHERLGVSKICNRLNALKIPPKKGVEWTAATIRDILINPVYTGKLRWNWRKEVKRRENGKVVVSRPRSEADDCILTDGLHEAIISQDTFDAAQEIMSSNRSPATHDRTSIQNPLVGLMVCGKCGRRMQRRPYNSTSYPAGLICTYKSCDNVSSALALVEESLLDSLREWLDEYKLQWAANNALNDPTISIKQSSKKKLIEELRTLSVQRDKLHDLLEQGIYDTSTFLDRSRKLAARIDQMEKDVASINAEIDTYEQIQNSRASIIPKIERLLNTYSSLASPKAKNEVLKEVLEKVVYTKEVRARDGGRPDGFELTLYPRLPRK